jgi:hypothetical protein
VTSTGAYNFAYTLSSSAADLGCSFIAVFKEGSTTPTKPRPLQIRTQAVMRSVQ